MSSETAIRVENLSKCYQIYDHPRDRLKQFIFPRARRLMRQSPKQYYREFWALKDLSFEIEKGETVGIIGRNGSGKSTLLQLICGTLNQTSGTIQCSGRIAALLELGSGFNPEFTGRENIFMNASVLGLSKKEIDARYDDIVAFSELADFVERPVKTYSSGMLVRLAFSVAINVDPEILVVDEALSVGDELFQRKCFSRIETIRKNGATILFVSHSGSQIIELCDRAVVLDCGEILAIGNSKRIVGHYQKLIYAPADKRDGVRESIRRGGLKGDAFDYVMDASSKNGSEPAISSPDVQEKESFDPNLKPNSTIEYESHGALIVRPEIFTLDGRQVNGLVRGRKYRYCYRVDFSRSVTNVRFGMAIRTTTGLSIGGALSAPSLKEAVPIVNGGQMLNVEFMFNCYLNPGVYFMNAGVFGCVGHEETVLHRKADVVAFRVLPVRSNIDTEIVSFGFDPKVSFDEQVGSPGTELEFAL